MNQNSALVVFEEKNIRRTWFNDEWWYSVVDVAAVLTDSTDPRNYWKVLKHRLIEEGSEVVTNCNQLKLLASDGKYYQTDCANTKILLRIIQSIPSKKAEPFKQWLAQVGYERIQEIENPELAQNRAKEYYEQEKQRILTDLQTTKTGLQNLLTLAKERPGSRHIITELDNLEAQERTLERKIHETELQIQRCEPIDYSELERYCTAVLEHQEEIRKEDLEKRREIFFTFVKEFTVDKSKKEVSITFYGIPMLPIVRNAFLEEQERKLEDNGAVSFVQIPEYAVILPYRKRRFLVPQEYSFARAEQKLEELVADENTGEEEQEANEEQILSTPEQIEGKEQLKLF